LCCILNSDEVDRSEVRLQQQLTLYTLADSITTVTHSGNPLFPPCRSTIQLAITTRIGDQSAPVTATITGGPRLGLHLVAADPSLDLSVSNHETIAWFVRAISAKAPAHFPRRGQLERLCKDTEASAD